MAIVLHSYFQELLNDNISRNEKQEVAYTVGESVSPYNHFRKHLGNNIKLRHSPEPVALLACIRTGMPLKHSSHSEKKLISSSKIKYNNMYHLE